MDANSLVRKEIWEESESALVTVNGLEVMPLAPKRAFVFTSSGTTGDAKYMVLQKTGILASAQCVNKYLGVDKTSVWGMVLPWWHVGGMGVAARSYVAGCRMVHWVQRWGAKQVFEWLRREKVTHLSLVPTQVYDLIREGYAAPSSLQAVVVGGGRLSAEDGVKARELGWPVLSSFGMTEAGSQIATQQLADLKRSFDLCELQILDCWQVRTDAEGTLEIAGEPLFSGSMRNEAGVWQFTARQGEWWKTQDHVELDGRWLRWLGRADDVVKILGELVSVRAVEDELVVAGMLRDRFAVIAHPDERKGSILQIFSELACDADVARYHARCAGFARISDVYVMSLPRTELGKIKRGALGKLLGL